MDFEQTLAELNTEIQANPFDPEPLVERGNLRAEVGDYQSAIEDYTAALAFAPDLALIWDNRGVAHLYLLDYYAALADFSQALVVSPDYYYALANRAYVYASLEKPQWALDDAYRALAVASDLAPAYDVIGQALAQLGRLEESLVALDQAQSLDRHCVQVPYHQAQVLYKLGRYEEARHRVLYYLTLHDDQQNATGRRQAAQTLLILLDKPES